jgi:hypothetical protein
MMSGVGDHNTKLVFKNKNGVQEFWGPVFSSRRQQDSCGTPYWIDQIYVSRDANSETAYKAAFASASKGLGNPNPWHTLDSSIAGLHATLHVVGAEDVPIGVARMVTDPDKLNDEGRPYVLAVAAWETLNDMSAFEVADFDQTSRIVCRAAGVLGQRIEEPARLRDRWLSGKP